MAEGARVDTGQPPRASVIVPAHDEAAVIARTLSGLLPGIETGALEVIVVANGCRDRTAAIARAAHPDIVVLERGRAGKGEAMEAGRAVARAPIHVHLDADLIVTADGIEALLAPLEAGRALAACGAMRVDTSGSPPAVRAFYAAWALHPYFDHGKFGGLFALSAAGRARVARFAGRIADDEYARRAFRPEERVFVPACVFVAQAPRRFSDLVRVRRRARRGTRSLGAVPSGGARAVPDPLRHAGRLARRPRLWPAAFVYFAVVSITRFAVVLERPAAHARWERDESARALAPGPAGDPS